MKKRYFLWRVRSFVLGITLLFAGNIFSQTFHVRSGASGNGSDWNNAFGSLPSTLVRGATYYIADGSYSGYSFDDAESGTAVITIRKATESDHGSSVGWNSTYGDGQAAFNGDFLMVRDYYVIDGQKRNELNWKDDSSYGFKIRSVYGQNLSLPPGGDHITVKYASIGGNYSETYYSGMEPAIYCGGFAGNFHHWTISRSFLHNSTHTIVQFAGANDMVIEYSFIGPGWGKEAIRGQVSAYNITVRHNTFYDSTQTDPEDSTSGITAEIGVWSGSNHDNWHVYGNTFSNSKSGGRNSVIVIGGNGGSWPGPGASGAKVYNNTFAGVTERSVFGMVLLNGSNNEAVNNLFYNCGDSSVNASRTANNVTLTANPFVNYSGYNFRLASGSGARNVGSVAGAAPFNIDRDGTIRGSDGSWDVGAFEFANGAPDTIAPTISGVSASSIGTTSATIVWSTDEPATSRVEYGTTTGYGASANGSGYVTSHSLALSGLSAGTLYHFKVSSTDSAGNTRSSADFTFTTAAPDTTPPTISSVSSSSITARSARITWTTDEPATAGVDYGTSTAYGLSTNRTSLATSHTMSLQNLTPGALYNYRVRSADNAGNVRTSVNFTFTTPAADTVPPTVTLSAPSSGATLTGQATLTASASDTGSGVTQVRFYANSVLLGSATGAGGSYSFVWNTSSSANGSYQIYAIARDADGNEATSATVGVSVQNVGPDLRTGLVGHWTLDQTSSSTAVPDSSPAANHGVLQNGPGYVVGQLREGLQLDGADDFVRVENNTNIDRSFPITLSVWIKPQVNGGWQSVLTKLVAAGSHSSPFSAYDLSLVDDGGSTFRPWLAVSGAGGTREYATSSTPYAYGSWYHLAGTYDGANLRTYVNGLLVATVPFSSAIVRYDQPLYLGANGAGNDRFKGIMDDVRIYSRALSGNEVQALFNTKTPQAPEGVQLQP
jgi:hypothetical protein